MYKVNLAFFVVLVLLTNPSVYSVDSQTQNFSVTILYNSDNQNLKSVVSNLQYYWEPLNVKVNIVGLPYITFLSELNSQTKTWDFALTSFDNGQLNYPIPYTLYNSQNSVIANIVFGLNDSRRLQNTGINMSQVNELTKLAYETTDKANRQTVLAEFQKKYMQEWLIDLPLLTKLGVQFTWNGLTNYDPISGLMNSIYSGLKWNTIEQTQKNGGGANDTLRLVIQDGSSGFNPMFSLTSGERQLERLIFPKLFLFDKQYNPHPDMGIYYKTTNNNDGSYTWNIGIRKNASWVDLNGNPIHKITSKDVKFTFDILRFPWIASLKNDFTKRIESISIQNDTNLSFKVNGFRQSDLFYLGNQMLIPEFKLNTTLTFNGKVLGKIYDDKISPVSSQEWQDFALLPTSGSMYYLSYAAGLVADLKANPNFWWPVDSDVLSYNGSKPIGSSFLNWNDNPQTPQIERPTKPLISKISYTYIEDKINLFLQFSNGRLDLVDSRSSDSLSLFKNKPEIKRINYLPKDRGTTIIVNYQNPILRPYEIRRALLAAINLTQLTISLGNGQLAQYSPVSRGFPDYYTGAYGIPYNFTVARDLFRSLGYSVKDSVSPTNNGGNNIIPSLPINFSNVVTILTGILVGVYIAYHKRKRM